MRLLFLSLLFPLSMFSQNMINWEEEITVADGSMYGNMRPRITLDSDDSPIVVMGKGADNKIFSAKWNGTGFSTPVDLLPVGMGAYLASWTGPDIAAKGDTVVVVFKEVDLDNGHIYTIRSTNGGTTFSDTVRVDNHPGGVVWLPAMDMDANGNPSIVFMAHENGWTSPRYHVAHSFDQGLSYQNALDVANGISEEACDCCPAEYLIDGNRHAMLYRNNNNNIRDIHGVFSEDNGVNYNSFDNVDQLGWNITSCPSTGPHGLFTSDRLLTVYSSRASGNYRVYLSESTTTGGLQFSQRRMMTPPTNVNGMQNHPRISGSQDSIFVVWQESESANLDIMCAFTIDGDLDILESTKHKVNINLSGSQTNPDLIYRNGFVHLVFQDGPSGDVIYKRGSVGTLGAPEEHFNHFKIFPNPSVSNEFTVSTAHIKDVKSIQVISETGSLVDFETEINKEQIKIRLSGVTVGVYLIEITLTSGERHVEKINVNY